MNMDLIIDIMLAIAALVISLSFWPSYLFLKLRTKRNIIGTWFAAFEAPYYEGKGWVFQKITIKAGFLGFKLSVEATENSLIWDGLLKLKTDTLISGKWVSRRKGSKSRGILSLQHSSNGNLAWGHIFAHSNDNTTAKIGAFIMARNEGGIPLAWKALKSPYPKLSRVAVMTA